MAQNEGPLVSIDILKNYEIIDDDSSSSTLNHGSFCLPNPELDEVYKYCGFYGALDLPRTSLEDLISVFDNFSFKSLFELMRSGQTYLAMIDVKNLESMAKDVRMDVEFADSTKSEAEEQGISFLPQLINMTSGDNLALRRFYLGTCKESEMDEDSRKCQVLQLEY